MSEDLTIAPPSEGKYIFRDITMFEKLIAHNDPDVDLVSDNEYTKFA